MASPRIGVAGLNPHAHGPEKDAAIAPGVAQARAGGIDASGPISPDTVFRHCIDGRYDVVVAMCRDQGHIALKTWGFEGNCGGFIGMPYLVGQDRLQRAATCFGTQTGTRRVRHPRGRRLLQAGRRNTARLATTSPSN